MSFSMTHGLELRTNLSKAIIIYQIMPYKLLKTQIFNANASGYIHQGNTVCSSSFFLQIINNLSPITSPHCEHIKSPALWSSIKALENILVHNI